MVEPLRPEGLTLLFWNQASANSATTFHGNVGYIGWRDGRKGGETFWGYRLLEGRTRLAD
jgi:hypothetical protein